MTRQRTVEEIFSATSPVWPDEDIVPLVVGVPSTGFLGYLPRPSRSGKLCGEVDTSMWNVSCTLSPYHEGPHIHHSDDFVFIWEAVRQLTILGERKWSTTPRSTTPTSFSSTVPLLSE